MTLQTPEKISGIRRARFARLAWAVLIACQVVWGATASANGESDVLVVFSSTRFEETKAAARRMVELGARVFSVFQPHVYFVRLPLGVKGKILHEKESLGIFKIHPGPLDPEKVAFLGDSAVSAVEIWNASLKIDREDTLEKRERKDLPFEDRVLVAPPPQEPSLTRTQPGGASHLFRAQPEDTSEYMIGNPLKIPNITVLVIFAQFEGDPFSWTEAERAVAKAKIERGGKFWADRAPSCLQLSFHYEYCVVPTTVDPMTTSPIIGGPPLCPGTQGIWINEIMDILHPLASGFSCYFDKVISFAHARSADPANDTNWVVTIFLVDDDNDADGRFADGETFAYTYLGGPFIVMTKNNDGWGFINLDASTAHEMGHDFYALDEYCCASSPGESSGYLNIVNGNHLLAFPGVCPGFCPNSVICPSPPPPSGVCCIMRGGFQAFLTSPPNGLCDFTKNMIGWRDGDGDLDPDITDVPPQVPTISPTPPGLIDAATTLVINGIARVGVRPSENPQPGSSGRSINVDTITKVFFTIDGAGPSPADPTDGKFDFGQESFFFSVGPFPANTFQTIEVFAESTNGCVDQVLVGPPRRFTLGILPAGVKVTTCPP